MSNEKDKKKPLKEKSSKKMNIIPFKKNGNDWFGEDGIYKAKITHTMSDQLWYKVPLDTVLDGREYTFD